MVALAEPRLPDAKGVDSILGKQWPQKPRFSGFRRDGDVLSVEVGAAFGAISLMPVPIPAGDIRAACAASLAWPESESTLQKHTAHLICVVKGPVEPKTAAFQLTKLVAAVCQTSPALGVYWGSATMVHAPEVFVGQAREMTEDILPLYLWIQFAASARDGKVTLWTHGMWSLGFMELEVVESARQAEDVARFTFNIAHYLLDHGPVLGDGHTIGLSAQEQVLVRHCASTVEPERMVYRLSL
jgi:hypothetical protein